MKTQRQTLGFTLIELLVSVTILTVMVLCVAKIMADATDVTTAGYRQASDDGGARAVMDMLMDDLMQSVAYRGPNPSSLGDNVFLRAQDEAVTYGNFSCDTLMLVATLGPKPPKANGDAPDDPKHRQTLKTVYYRVDANEDFWILKRGDRWGALSGGAAYTPAQMDTYPVLDHVVEFKVMLYTESGNPIDGDTRLGDVAMPEMAPGVLIYLSVLSEEAHKKAMTLLDDNARMDFIRRNAHRYFSRAYMPTRIGRTSDKDYTTADLQ